MIRCLFWKFQTVCKHEFCLVNVGYLQYHPLPAAGPCLSIKTVFPGMEIPMLKIRQLWDHLIFNMGIPILMRRYLYIKPQVLHSSIDISIWFHIFSCDQAALWMVFSVRLSVCLSVCPSVRLLFRGCPCGLQMPFFYVHDMHVGWFTCMRVAPRMHAMSWE